MGICRIGRCCDFSYEFIRVVLFTPTVDIHVRNPGQDMRDHYPDDCFYFYSDTDVYIEELVWKEGFDSQEGEYQIRIPEPESQVYPDRFG